LSNSVKKANSLCNIIASHQFLDLNNLTCSFGVTDLKNDDTIKTIFKRVDELLYQAKENGRNRVEYI
ncbi:MAG TPA: diguanylate cyclase, partial [Arcobacter sp.]|nr:diguanylate cyclase [Arcobacter sp.]